MARERQQTPLRLTPDHLQRVDKAAEHCGQTRQAFMQTAILAEVAEVEERARMKRLRVRPTDPGPTQQTHELDTSSASVGIGISSRRRREIEEMPPAPISTAAPIVVNVGGGNAAGAPGSDIERLATFVVNGNDFDRDVRLRTAVSVLHASAATEEERKVLAARLDEAVAVKSKTPTNSSYNGNGGVMKAARFAYDKFADFWKE